MTLISASELAALRGVAELGMVTPASVYRKQNVEDENGQHSEWTLQSTVQGWLYSEPTPILTINAGQLADVNTVRFFCPVGSDVQTGDKLVVSGSEYTVSDTNSEGTWLPLLRCSLRRSE
jgi:hypothetical protein